MHSSERVCVRTHGLYNMYNYVLAVKEGIMRMRATKHELPAAEAAVLLRRSRERVIRLIQTGDLPGRRVPGVGWVVDRKAAEDRAQRRDIEQTNTKARRAG